MLFAHAGNVQTSIKGKPLRTSRSQIFFKIAALKNFAILSRKTCVAEYLFNKVAGMKVCIFIKKETPAQLFSCEYCEIFKNTYFEEWQMRTTTSDRSNDLFETVSQVFWNVNFLNVFHPVKVDRIIVAVFTSKVPVTKNTWLI